MLTDREKRIAEARLAHAVFPDHCLPDPEDDAAWELLAEKAAQDAAKQGIDLEAIGKRAEERALEAIRARGERTETG